MSKVWKGILYFALSPLFIMVILVAVLFYCLKWLVDVVLMITVFERLLK